MGFFDSKWIVEFEFSEGLLRSIKKATMVVEATSEYSAKDKAKSVLKHQYSYVKILSAKKSNGKVDERKTTYSTDISIETKKQNQIVLTESRRDEPSPEEKERARELRKQRAELLEKQRRDKEIIKLGLKLKKIKNSHITASIIGGVLTLFAFLFGWIPYWKWDHAKKGNEWAVEEMIEFGHKMSEPAVQEFQNDANYALEMRNNVVWIPFVILTIGIVVTIIAIILVKKSQPKRIADVNKQIETFKEK